MSNYGEMYQRGKDVSLIKNWCPEWVKNECVSFEVKVEVAEGRKAKADLDSLRRDLEGLKRLVNA